MSKFTLNPLKLTITLLEPVFIIMNLVEKIYLDTDISIKAEVPIAIVNLLLKAYEGPNYIDCVKFAGYT